MVGKPWGRNFFIGANRLVYHSVDFESRYDKIISKRLGHAASLIE
jgi:hypothetical protein